MGYYQRFFKDVTKTLEPFNDLLKGSDKAKKRKITWLDVHKQAVTEIKEALKSAENLNHDDKYLLLTV